MISPAWRRTLERRLQWLAIPNIGVLLVTLQALGFVAVCLVDPSWQERLSLDPEQVSQGQYFRLVTFLALPLSSSPIWVLFVLWFLYFILTAIESALGSLKTTLYVLTSIAAMIAYSFAAGYPVTDVRHFESSLFLASAVLFPEMEVSLFMLVPVKMKVLAALSLVFVVLELYQGSWLERGLLMTVYSSFVLFFGPAAIERYRLWRRRRRFKDQMRR